MPTTFIGEQFSLKDPWGRQDHAIVDSVQAQVDQKFNGHKNLIITTTWFGEQFQSLAWNQVQALIKQEEKFENLFWLAPVDPLCMLPEDFQKIEKALGVGNSYYIGTSINNEYEFNTGAIACLEDFPAYPLEDLYPTEFKYVYLCYNRKPKLHRVNLVNLLLDNRLEDRGVITLGETVDTYDITESADYRGSIKIDDHPENYTRDGFYNLITGFGGVPYDLTSLGRLDIWQQHFLNIVSESEYREWDNRFVTEKTWKPIIGLRPFVINGQIKIYQWLRNNGFKTFNHYFSVDLENSIDEQVQPAIVEVVKFLVNKDTAELHSMYQDMLPDLEHNRARFFEFAQEQKIKLGNLFND
jgi:hypothetical protein